ncbi:E3 SUMO-protein ligase NSE2-like [Dermacentor variabilis]|uniref:E3 SUMO-protein ligase NSE2-like n=1 Tax=Dermacentor variabilis TaxID=34621 RepID=UPI003F5B309F
MASFTPFDMAVDDLKRLNCYVVQGLDVILGVAADVCEVGEGDALNESVEALKLCAKGMIKEEYDADSFVVAATALKAQARQTAEANRQLDWKQELASTYEAAKQRQGDPENHVAFKNLLRITSRVEEVSSSQDLEDSMTVTEDIENVQWKDPITQKDIEAPVKNTKCSHVYDKNSISQYIKSTRHPRCPYLGCANKATLNMRDLVDDHFVARILNERSKKKD